MNPDVLVVGAGPSGVSAALWARSLGLTVKVVERDASAGGQLHWVHFAPTNVAIAARGAGTALAARLAAQLVEGGIETHYESEVATLAHEGTVARLADGSRLEARAVLIASGVRRRTLEVPGESELDGRGVSYSATQDRARFAGEDVAVIGGGDAAFENALLLSDVGCHVTLVVRGTPRARAEFRERVGDDPRIEMLERTRVVAIEGNRSVTDLRLANEQGDFQLPVAGLVIKIGVRPNSEWCQDAVEHDAEGYVLVDETFATSHPRVWAAGDVTRPPVFGIAVAAGQGALAAASIRTALRG